MLVHVPACVAVGPEPQDGAGLLIRWYACRTPQRASQINSPLVSATTALITEAEASPLPPPHLSMLRAGSTVGSGLGALFLQGAFPCPSTLACP